MKFSLAATFGWGGAGVALGLVVGFLSPVIRKEAAVAPPPPPVPLLEKPPPPEPPPEAPPVETGSRELLLLEKLARASRAELETLTAEMLKNGENYFTMLSLCDRWIELDPERGYELLTAANGPPPVPRVRSFVWSYLGRWSLKAPDTAVKKMLSLGNYDLRIASSRISHELSIKRPADFFRLLPELKKGDDADFCIATAAKTLGFQDPAAAVKLWKEWPVNQERRMGEPSAASERARVLAFLMTGWAKADPQAAIAWARDLPDSRDRAAAVANAARHVAGEQPEMAASLLKEAYGAGGPANTGALNEALRNTAGDWAATDPDAALKWLSANFGTAGKSVARDLAAEQIPRESGAAVDYFLRHADLFNEAGKIRTFSYNTWTPDDPQAGLARAAEITDPVQRQTVEDWFLKAMAHKSPEEAITAAQSGVRDAGARQDIIQTALTAWATTDITAASRWMKSQAAGTERDAAIRSMLPAVLRMEPESALPWAAALSTPEARGTELLTILRQTGDAAEAGRMLAELPIPGAEKSAILSKLNPSPATPSRP